MEDMLDVENKRMAESLASKVTRLKSVSCWCCGEGKAVIAVVRLQGLTSNTNVWSVGFLRLNGPRRALWSCDGMACTSRRQF